MNEFDIADSCETTDTCPRNCSYPPGYDKNKDIAKELPGDGIDNNCDGKTDDSACGGCNGSNMAAGSTINVASGNLNNIIDIYKDELSLVYNSNDTTIGPLGQGWTHAYNLRVDPANGANLALTKGDGKRVYFWSNNGVYEPESTSNEYSKIVKNTDGTYTQTTKDGIVYNFNSSGQLAAIVDRNGNTTGLTYNTSGELIEIKYPSGRTVSLVYTSGKITEIDTPGRTNGQTVATYIGYTNGNITSITQPESKVWSFAYDGTTGKMTSKTEGNGTTIQHTTIYQYDPGTGRATTVTDDGEGTSKSFTYDLTTTTVTVTERDGGVWTYVYDKNMDVITQETNQQLGNTTVYTYDTATRQLTKKTNPDGTYTEYGYYTYTNGPGFPDLISEKSYSAQDVLTAETAYAYEYTSGYITRLTKTEKKTDATNVVTVYNYDATAGNLTSLVTDSGGSSQETTYYTYNTDTAFSGTLASITNPAGKTTNFEYYSGTRDLYQIKKPTVTRADGTTVRPTTTFTYDNAGNMTSATDPTSKTVSYVYDDLNRLTTITEPPSYTTQFTYTPMGYVASVTDANGNATSYQYNRKGSMTKVTEPTPNNYVTNLAYADAGGSDQLKSLTNARGKTASFTHNMAGNLTRETSPLGYATDYAWSQGHLASRTDANGNTTSYEYDALGRLTKRTYPDGNYDLFRYDYLGNLTYALSTAYGYGGIAHEFAYDGQGRVTSATDSRGYNLNYTYNPTNTRATMNMVWQGQTVSYAYDENDRLRYIYLSGSPARSWQLQYDDAGRRSKLLHNNGVYSLYNYNSTSKRLYQILHYTSTNSFLDGYSYAYNNAGNITGKTTGTASLTYTYNNNNNRLTDSSLTISGNTTYEHFTYDQAGNRLSGPAASTTYSYDDDDRMSTMTGYTGITYDNNGNLTGRTLTATGEVWTYTYDYENRLVQALKKIGGAVKTDSTFKYDALGRRVYRKVIAYGPPVTEEKEFTYIYDGFDLVQELVTRKLNGATQPFAYSTYVYGPGVDEPLYMNKNVGGVSSDYYYHADALGSVTSLTNSNQVIMESYRYTSYGEMTRTGSVMNKFLFTGRELDEETGLYYYRVRYLDPKTGRFTTKDPIGYEGGVNKYIYVQDNPVNLTDPLGLTPFAPAVAACLANPSCAAAMGAAFTATVYALTDVIYKFFNSSKPLYPPTPANDDWDDVRNQCIMLYEQCKDGKLKGNCNACFNKCLAQHEWPFNECPAGECK